MATFSDDLVKLQTLEEKYREQLAGYETELTAYRTLLEHDPRDPDVAKRYEEVDRKNREVQETYSELDRLRRSLGSASGAVRRA